MSTPILMRGCGDVTVWGYSSTDLVLTTLPRYIRSSPTQGCQCFFGGEAYIRQYPAPLAIYPPRPTPGGVTHFLRALAAAPASRVVPRGGPGTDGGRGGLVGVVVVSDCNDGSVVQDLA